MGAPLEVDDFSAPASKKAKLTWNQRLQALVAGNEQLSEETSATPNQGQQEERTERDAWVARNDLEAALAVERAVSAEVDAARLSRQAAAAESEAAQALGRTAMAEEAAIAAGLRTLEAETAIVDGKAAAEEAAEAARETQEKLAEELEAMKHLSEDDKVVRVQLEREREGLQDTLKQAKFKEADLRRDNESLKEAKARFKQEAVESGRMFEAALQQSSKDARDAEKREKKLRKKLESFESLKDLAEQEAEQFSVREEKMQERENKAKEEVQKAKREATAALQRSEKAERVSTEAKESQETGDQLRTELKVEVAEAKREASTASELAQTAEKSAQEAKLELQTSQAALTSSQGKLSELEVACQSLRDSIGQGKKERAELEAENGLLREQETQAALARENAEKSAEAEVAAQLALNASKDLLQSSEQAQEVLKKETLQAREEMEETQKLNTELQGEAVRLRGKNAECIAKAMIADNQATQLRTSEQKQRAELQASLHRQSELTEETKISRKQAEQMSARAEIAEKKVGESKDAETVSTQQCVVMKLEVAEAKRTASEAGSRISIAEQAVSQSLETVVTMKQHLDDATDRISELTRAQEACKLEAQQSQKREEEGKGALENLQTEVAAEQDAASKLRKGHESLRAELEHTTQELTALQETRACTQQELDTVKQCVDLCQLELTNLSTDTDRLREQAAVATAKAMVAERTMVDERARLQKETSDAVSRAGAAETSERLARDAEKVVTEQCVVLKMQCSLENRGCSDAKVSQEAALAKQQQERQRANDLDVDLKSATWELDRAKAREGELKTEQGKLQEAASDLKDVAAKAKARATAEEEVSAQLQEAQGRLRAEIDQQAQLLASLRADAASTQQALLEAKDLEEKATRQQAALETQMTGLQVRCAESIAKALLAEEDKKGVIERCEAEASGAREKAAKALEAEAESKSNEKVAKDGRTRDAARASKELQAMLQRASDAEAVRAPLEERVQAAEERAQAAEARAQTAELRDVSLELDVDQARTLLGRLKEENTQEQEKREQAEAAKQSLEDSLKTAVERERAAWLREAKLLEAADAAQLQAGIRAELEVSMQQARNLRALQGQLQAADGAVCVEAAALALRANLEVAKDRAAALEVSPSPAPTLPDEASSTTEIQYSASCCKRVSTYYRRLRSKGKSPEVADHGLPSTPSRRHRFRGKRSAAGASAGLQTPPSSRHRFRGKRCAVASSPLALSDTRRRVRSKQATLAQRTAAIIAAPAENNPERSAKRQRADVEL